MPTVSLSEARKLAREARRREQEKAAAAAEEEENEEDSEEEYYYSSDDEGRFDHYDISVEEWVEMEKILAEYRKLNYAIFRISSKTGAGTEDLKKLFDCRSPTLLVGQTGSGKSALLNMLCPDLGITTRTLSSYEQGRHTTSAIMEHILPSGCRVMDSPGFSNYGPKPVPPLQVVNGFVELQQLAALCKHRNCMHINEQDCGVRKAVELGFVMRSRYESYKNLVEAMMGSTYLKPAHTFQSRRHRAGCAPCVL